MFRMDTLYQRHHRWVGKTAVAPGAGMKAHAELARLPSEYFREHIYLTFQDDEVALRTLDLVNVDRLLWANDHPHSDATWPDSEAVHSRFAELVDAASLDKICRLNCASLYKVA
jgi:predicted TIM-barrel fold metal-dependent hydrolase